VARKKGFELAFDPTPEGLNLDVEISGGGCLLMGASFFFQERGWA